jgi:hypothetical protein
MVFVVTPAVLASSPIFMLIKVSRTGPYDVAVGWSLWCSPGATRKRFILHDASSVAVPA